MVVIVAVVAVVVIGFIVFVVVIVALKLEDISSESYDSINVVVVGNWQYFSSDWSEHCDVPSQINYRGIQLPNGHW